MDIALIGMRELRASGELDNLEVSEEVNAASIVVNVPISNLQSPNLQPPKRWLIMFKNETHNHPTEIEPFGGAATCLGGCIRDPLSGRSYVYQAMRVTGAGDPLTPFAETLPGKLPQKKICQVAAHGYSSYGNQIGLATGQVAEVYHPGYVAKRLEIGAVVAAAPRAKVFRGTPAPGDVILLIGGRTGRDGVGGATGSSKEHTDTALENSAEVQKGDAPTERKIQRLFRNPELTRKIKICNDFGAGGVSVAIGEIAPSLEINLDAVPKKYDGLDGTELAISESQERMAVCVDPIGNRLLHRRGRQGKPRMRARRRRHRQRPPRHDLARQNHRQPEPRLPRHQRRPAIRENPCQRSDEPPVFHCSLLTAHGSLVPFSRNSTSAPNAASARCSTAPSARAPCSGPSAARHQITPPDAMVAKLPLLEGDTDVCTHMSWGFDPYLSEKSPFHGAVYAVTESVCKAVASGAASPTSGSHCRNISRNSATIPNAGDCLSPLC
jgi:phosphoribosylformylglycinamidine synthase